MVVNSFNDAAVSGDKLLPNSSQGAQQRVQLQHAAQFSSRNRKLQRLQKAVRYSSSNSIAAVAFSATVAVKVAPPQVSDSRARSSSQEWEKVVTSTNGESLHKCRHPSASWVHKLHLQLLTEVDIRLAARSEAPPHAHRPQLPSKRPRLRHTHVHTRCTQAP